MKRELIEKGEALRMVRQAFVEYMAEGHTFRETNAAARVTAKATGRLQIIPKYTRPLARWTSTSLMDMEFCSNCKSRVMALALYDEIGDTVCTPFCPWCGAQMENPDEEAAEFNGGDVEVYIYEDQNADGYKGFASGSGMFGTAYCRDGVVLVFLDGVEPDAKIVEAFEGLTF